MNFDNRILVSRSGASALLQVHVLETAGKSDDLTCKRVAWESAHHGVAHDTAIHGIDHHVVTLTVLEDGAGDHRRFSGWIHGSFAHHATLGLFERLGHGCRHGDHCAGDLAVHRINQHALLEPVAGEDHFIGGHHTILGDGAPSKRLTAHGLFCSFNSLHHGNLGGFQLLLRFNWLWREGCVISARWGGWRLRQHR